MKKFKEVIQQAADKQRVRVAKAKTTIPIAQQFVKVLLKAKPTWQGYVLTRRLDEKLKMLEKYRRMDARGIKFDVAYASEEEARKVAEQCIAVVKSTGHEFNAAAFGKPQPPSAITGYKSGYYTPYIVIWI